MERQKTDEKQNVKTKKKHKKLFKVLFILYFIALMVFLVYHLFTTDSLSGFEVPENPDHLFAYDETDTLSAKTVSYINQVNKDLEPTGAQIAVAVLDSLNGEDIESAANQTFRTWGVGDSEKNNGVLLLVALKDHELRIEVGYGLEGAIPDGRAGYIIRNTITPEFAEDYYNDGIVNGVSELYKLVAQEYDLEVDSAAMSPKEQADKTYVSTDSFTLIMMGFVAIFILLLALSGNLVIVPGFGPYRSRGRYYGGNSRGGGPFGGGSFGGGSSGGGGASGKW